METTTNQQPLDQQMTAAGIPQLTPELITKIALSIGAGFAGRHYFGGMGGALLGAALYGVFLQPVIFPKK